MQALTLLHAVQAEIIGDKKLLFHNVPALEPDRGTPRTTRIGIPLGGKQVKVRVQGPVATDIDEPPLDVTCARRNRRIRSAPAEACGSLCYNPGVIKLIADANGVLLRVKVVPGASRTRYLGEWQERARIAVASPPEKGKANAALVDFLADMLGLSKRAVTIVAGAGTPLKTVRIEGITEDAIRAALTR